MHATVMVWGLEEQFGCSNNARKLCCVLAEFDESKGRNVRDWVRRGPHITARSTSAQRRSSGKDKWEP